MFLLTPSTTERYLRDRGELDPAETVRVTELSGGVSNQVLLIERGRGDRFVLKQAREQLRVEQEWKCDVRRIWREMDVLRLCGEVLREAKIGSETGINASVPEILFEDREHFCYAMSAASSEHQTWKQRLLAGHVESAMAETAGRMLGALHVATWQNANIANLVGDNCYFDALRVDPYYRRIAAAHPKLRDPIEELIASVLSNHVALVHGDFSPKNLLVSPRRMMLIDFEVGHFGDPAFDNGFFLSHLLLKGLAAGFQCDNFRQLAQAAWGAYVELVSAAIDGLDWQALSRRSVLNMAGCILARVDGKSQVDYLNETQRTAARNLTSMLFRDRPNNMEHAIAYLGTFDPW